MNNLSKLRPAETLLILNGKDASIKELLKFTFMDLLLKQVLQVFEVEMQASRREAIRVYDYVKPGKNFLLYTPFPHENVFLTPFKKVKDIKILFQNFVKIGYQNAESDCSYQLLLLKNPKIKDCFKRSLYQKIYGGFDLTSEGLELRKNLQSEIACFEKELPDLIVNKPQKTLEVLNNIKGNIFLLKNIEFDLLKKIDIQLLKEMHRYSGNDIDSGFGDIIWLWDDFDNYSESFDSSCISDSYSGDSGCSGDGGCSGCGGD